MVVKGFYKQEEEKVEKTYLQLNQKLKTSLLWYNHNMIYSFKTINQKEKPGFFVYFVAKKKVFKTAVYRNKAKRIARHAFLEAKRSVFEKEGFKDINKQVIFFLEKDIIQQSFETIVKSFINDLNKILNK